MFRVHALVLLAAALAPEAVAVAPEAKPVLETAVEDTPETLARVSHHPTAADADPSAVAGRTPSSRLDLVSAAPAENPL